MIYNYDWGCMITKIALSDVGMNTPPLQINCDLNRPALASFQVPRMDKKKQRDKIPTNHGMDQKIHERVTTSCGYFSMILP